MRTVLSASMHENSKTKKALSFVFNHQNDMTTNGPDSDMTTNGPDSGMTTSGSDDGMTTSGSDDGMTTSGSDDGMTTGDSDSAATTGGPDDGSPENSNAGQTTPGNAPAQTDSNAPAQTDSNDETTSAPTARFASESADWRWSRTICAISHCTLRASSWAPRCLQLSRN